MVLGAPGSGKTTFLRALEWAASKRLLSDAGAPLPLYIRLTQWPDSVTDLGSLIVVEQQVRALQAVPTRRLLLLLDELNEIDPESRPRKTQAIASWITANPEVPVVIATRRLQYKAGEPLPLPNVLLQPMDTRRVEAFIRNYLGDRADELLSGLIWERRKASARTLTHLAGNPYLLRLVCYVFDRTGQIPPPARAPVLAVMVESLWQRESSFQNTQQLQLAYVVAACSRLAIAMVSNGTSTSVHRDFALKHLPSDRSPQLFKVMEDASLIRTAKSGRFVQFTHQMLLKTICRGVPAHRSQPH